MKSIILFTLLLISSSVSANDALVSRFINAQTAMLQTQVGQLKSAIALIQSGISATEQYEQIGKPSFAATERALSQAGFTVKSYYKFMDNRKLGIEEWLSQHASKASELEQLKKTRDNLSQMLEGVN